MEIQPRITKHKKHTLNDTPDVRISESSDGFTFEDMPEMCTELR